MWQIFSSFMFTANSSSMSTAPISSSSWGSSSGSAAWLPNLVYASSSLCCPHSSHSVAQTLPPPFPLNPFQLELQLEFQFPPPLFDPLLPLPLLGQLCHEWPTTPHVQHVPWYPFPFPVSPPCVPLFPWFWSLPPLLELDCWLDSVGQLLIECPYSPQL